MPATEGDRNKTLKNKLAFKGSLKFLRFLNVST